MRQDETKWQDFSGKEKIQKRGKCDHSMIDNQKGKERKQEAEEQWTLRKAKEKDYGKWRKEDQSKPKKAKGAKMDRNKSNRHSNKRKWGGERKEKTPEEKRANWRCGREELNGDEHEEGRQKKGILIERTDKGWKPSLTGWWGCTHITH